MLDIVDIINYKEPMTIFFASLFFQTDTNLNIGVILSSFTAFRHILSYCSYEVLIFKWDKIYSDSHQNELPLCGEKLYCLLTAGLSNLIELLLGLSEPDFEFDHLSLHLLVMRLQRADKVTHLPIYRALLREINRQRKS